MKELFLIAALALPALPWSRDKVWEELIQVMQKWHPEYTIVLINKDIPLLNPDAIRTPIIFKDKWRVWGIKSAA